jgi:organic radical activating enzyme
MAGHASITRAETGRTTLRVTAVGDGLATAWNELRRLSSLPHVATLGAEQGFRIEDVTTLTAHVDPTMAAGPWLKRRLPAECTLTILPCSPRAGAELDACFARRGENATSQRMRYERGKDARVRVEAFELHPVEHCNLRCAHCCNLSLYARPRFRSVEALVREASAIARCLAPDVFKLSGGEPLLHPDITTILRAVHDVGVAPVVRLFTNGLLLHRMPDDFWAALDQLTVSDYASAPLGPARLAVIASKAKAFDVVLNVKPVDAFSQVVASEPQSDPNAIADTYRNCWLRHRCMMVRDGVFYACTRAAYADVFRTRWLGDESPSATTRDGVPLDGEDFADRLYDYLNRREPLEICRYCLGSDGPTLGHAQLRARQRIDAASWATRRPAGKARGGGILDVLRRRATMPAGMDRRPNRCRYSLTGPYP